MISGAVDGEHPGSLSFVDIGGAVKVARFLARFLAGGRAVVAASSSSSARLRLPPTGV